MLLNAQASQYVTIAEHNGAREDQRRSSPQRLRVLQVTPRYYPDMGGVENHVYQVATRLAEQNVDVSVLTTDRSGQRPSYEMRDGVMIHRVRAWPTDKDFYFAPALQHMIANGNWDLMHLQSYHTFVAPLAMQAARQATLPYVVTFHGGGHSSRLRTALRGIQWTLLRPLLAHAERLIAVADFEVPLFSQRLQVPLERFTVIPNGADLPQLTQAVATPAIEPLIVSVGRLERYKGHQRVIAALPVLLKQYPQARLRIIGSGPYEGQLRQLAQRLGVAQHVDIYAVPATERQAMARELAQAALVVLLSDYETQPLAVLEALGLGRPVLVADTSGLRELAARGLARAIPLAATPEQAASAMLEQLRNPLVPPMINLPTWNECASQLLSLYQSIIRKTQCAF